MGKALVIKNADFSENAVGLENVFDVIKQTDIEVATPAYSMATQRYMNTIALDEDVKIIAFAFVVSEKTLNATDNDNEFTVGATNGTNVLRSKKADLSDIITKAKNGDIAVGSVQIAMLQSELEVNEGEYIYFAAGGSKCPVSYAREKSGEYGLMKLIGGSDTNYNLAATFYGMIE